MHEFIIGLSLGLAICVLNEKRCRLLVTREREKHKQKIQSIKKSYSNFLTNIE